MPTAHHEKYRRLQTILREMKRCVLAYSGGVDSVFMLKAAVDTLGSANVLAVTGRSPAVPQRELEGAVTLAAQIGATHEIIDTQEFADPNYLANPTNRCYYCKTELYGRLAPLLAERGFGAVINGVNADDLGDYRPGLKAAGEHQVRAPLAEAGLTKLEIRALSAEFGLPTADKPASPCLSSRLPYGESVTPEKLAMIEAAETFLHELGYRECRVRHHDRIARIEVPESQVPELMAADIRKRIDHAFREIGYTWVTVDLRGLRSGNLNDVIAFGKRQGIPAQQP